jgi:histidinol-phosphate aminotransferase
MTKQTLPLRADLRDWQAYGAPQLDVPVRLNTNENSHPLPPDVVAAVVSELAQVVGGLNRYPDREFSELRQELAGYLGHGLVADQIWAGNGSNEILLHLAQAFGGAGRTALGFTPGYAMHPIIAETAGTGWVHGHRGGVEDGFALTAEQVLGQAAQCQPTLIFLASPNNPTGTALDLSLVEAVYAGTELAERPPMVIIDEAYAEFARPGTPSALSLLPGRPRLVVTRTMSKAFAFAGARLGYLAADPSVCQALRLVRLPYHLSTLTQAAATAAIRHCESLLATVTEVKAERDRMVAGLAKLGLSPVASDANFVLFGGLADAPGTWSALVERGVLIRDVGIAGHLRVTAGTSAETDAFLSALADTLKAVPPAKEPS